MENIERKSNKVLQQKLVNLENDEATAITIILFTLAMIVLTIAAIVKVITVLLKIMINVIKSQNAWFRFQT